MSNTRDFDELNGPFHALKGKQPDQSVAGELWILAIDTATTLRSAAIVHGNSIVSLRSGEHRQGSSTSILNEIDQVLNDASISLKQIDLLAGANGPGSFTGLRSGLATLKALALTLGKPVVAVPTLHAVAHSAGPSKSVVAMIPAGRDEVYAQHLSIGDEGDVNELGPVEHLPPDALIKRFADSRGSVRWAGSGAVKFRVMIEEVAREIGLALVPSASVTRYSCRSVWELPESASPLAESVAVLAQGVRRLHGAYESGEAGALRAMYVRAPDARLKSA